MIVTFVVDNDESVLATDIGLPDVGLNPSPKSAP